MAIGRDRESPKNDRRTRRGAPLKEISRLDEFKTHLRRISDARMRWSTRSQQDEAVLRRPRMHAFSSRNRDRRPPENAGLRENTAGLREITESIIRRGDDTRCDGVKMKATVAAIFRGFTPPDPADDSDRAVIGHTEPRPSKRNSTAFGVRDMTEACARRASKTSRNPRRRVARGTAVGNGWLGNIPGKIRDISRTTCDTSSELRVGRIKGGVSSHADRNQQFAQQEA